MAGLDAMPSFRTVLLASGGNNVGIEVPEEVVASFGRGKRVPVVVTIDGGYSYRNTCRRSRGETARLAHSPGRGARTA